MDSSRAKTFQQMADELGIRHKLMYTLREASRVTGVPYDTLRIECKGGPPALAAARGAQGGAHGAPGMGGAVDRGGNAWHRGCLGARGSSRSCSR